MFMNIYQYNEEFVRKLYTQSSIKNNLGKWNLIDTRLLSALRNANQTQPPR